MGKEKRRDGFYKVVGEGFLFSSLNAETRERGGGYNNKQTNSGRLQVTHLRTRTRPGESIGSKYLHLKRKILSFN